MAAMMDRIRGGNVHLKKVNSVSARPAVCREVTAALPFTFLLSSLSSAQDNSQTGEERRHV